MDLGIICQKVLPKVVLKEPHPILLAAPPSTQMHGISLKDIPVISVN